MNLTSHNHRLSIQLAPESRQEVTPAVFSAGDRLERHHRDYDRSEKKELAILCQTA